jgi:hypothetical protein
VNDTNKESSRGLVFHDIRDLPLFSILVLLGNREDVVRVAVLNRKATENVRSALCSKVCQLHRFLHQSFLYGGIVLNGSRICDEMDKGKWQDSQECSCGLSVCTSCIVTCSGSDCTTVSCRMCAPAVLVGCSWEACLLAHEKYCETCVSTTLIQCSIASCTYHCHLDNDDCHAHIENECMNCDTARCLRHKKVLTPNNCIECHTKSCWKCWNALPCAEVLAVMPTKRLGIPTDRFSP